MGILQGFEVTFYDLLTIFGDGIGLPG